MTTDVILQELVDHIEENRLDEQLFVNLQNRLFFKIWSAKYKKHQNEINYSKSILIRNSNIPEIVCFLMLPYQSIL